MAITFNTNLSALTSQRYLGIASDKTSSSLAKLSSGSRVPTAKDDAAALAVGSKLRAEVAGLNTAANNASQAISLLQIADGALSTTGDILVRMKALATQSSSGQLGQAERALLDQEYQSLLTEIGRISSVTNFNGTSLLNGGDVVVNTTEGKLGSLADAGISINRYDSNITGDDHVYRITYNYAANGASDDTGLLTLQNVTTGNSETIDIRSLITSKTGEAGGALTTNLGNGQTVDVNFTGLGVTLTLNQTFDVDGATQLATNNTIGKASALGAGLFITNEGDVLALATGNEIGGTGTTVTLNSEGLTGAAIAAWKAASLFDEASGQFAIYTGNATLDTTTFRIADFNALSGAAGDIEMSVDGAAYVTANTNVGTSGVAAHYLRFRIQGQTSHFLELNIAATVDTAATATQDDGVLAVNLGNAMFAGDEVTTTTKAFNFKVGTGTSVNDSVSFTLNAASASALGIASTNITGADATNANAAITALNIAIDRVASRRADIGASQSRLDFAGASIAVAIENTTAAQSGLLDVDVSAEITEFTSQQVLLQAGVSLLAQANQQPALLLRLLQ